MPDRTTLFSAPEGRSGLMIGVSTVLAIAFVAHHPVPAVHAGAGVLDAIDHIRAMDHIVHGGLVALMLAFMAGFAGFVEYVGAGRPAMRLGLLVYLTGCLAAIGAATLDGFVIPDVARHFVAAPAGEQAIAYGLIVLAGFGIQSFTKLAFVLMSVAIVAWAVGLLAAGGPGRTIGLVGLLAGGAPAVLLITTGMMLRPPELLAILGAQSVWNLCIAWALIRNPGALGGTVIREAR